MGEFQFVTQKTFRRMEASGKLDYKGNYTFLLVNT